MMHPLFLYEVHQAMVEDRARAHHDAIALQSRRTSGRNRARLRSALGVRLVRLGERLVA